MRYFFLVLIGYFFAMSSCRSTRHINQLIAPIDSSSRLSASLVDSIKMVDSAIQQFKSHHITFNTFSAKIKVEAEGTSGKQPDLTAVVKIIRDSSIWISISSTFLNIEVYRLYITHDSLILLNKQDKWVQYRSLDYLQDITGIPFDYKTLEDLLVGNPIFYSDNITSFQRQENFTLLSTRTELFKNLLTLTNDTRLMVHSKLDDLDIARHRTGDITYGEYENKDGIYFPVYRQIIATEKNNLDIKLTYKQYEFNKELSVNFSVPKNYKKN